MGRRRQLRGRVLLAGAAGAAICLGAAGLWHRSVARRVDEAIAVAAADPGPGALAVEPVAPREPRAGVRLWTSTRGAADGAALEGRLVVATGGGLVELEPASPRPRVVTAVSAPGISDHDLTAAAALQGPGALALGTRSGAVAVIEPGGARSVRLDHGARGAVTDLAWFEGSLYAATASGALIRLSRDLGRAALVGPVVEGGLAALAAGPRGLVAAGGDGAVYRLDGAALARVAEPAAGERARLTAVAWLGDRVLAGSPLGLLAAAEGGRLEPVRPDLFVTALLAHDDRLYVGTTDRGVLVLDGGHPGAEPLRQLLDGRWISRIRAIDGRPVAFGPGLVARLDPGDAASGPALELPAGLAGNHVTALALDDQRRLWVGHFEDGVDVLSGDGEVARHLPGPAADPELAIMASVNALAYDAWAGAMLVGTSHGVLEVDEAAVTVLDGRDGLIGDSVTAILVTRDARAFATGQGLTVAPRLGELRSIYAFHGLPSNRLSALASDGGGQLVVGSLGGAARVDAATLEVGPRLEASPAGLRASWCAALAAAPEGTYVGTVGGGVDLWLPGGEVERLELPGAERLTVNPGAMLVVGDRLLVGTVERGVLVLDRARRAWVEVEQPLPGASVTALAADGEALYLGTDRGLLRLDPGGLEG